MQDNPFADLIPQQSDSNDSGNPFADLVPARMSAPMSGQPAENKGNFLSEAARLAREYVNEPVESLRAGLMQGASKAGTELLTLPRALGIPMGGVGDTLKQNQQARDQEFKQQYGDNTLAGLGAFAARELPEFAGGLGLARKALTKLPAALSSTPFRNAVVSNALAGAGVKQAQSPEDSTSALEGAAVGAGAGALGRGLDKFIIQPGAKWFAESAIPGFIERAISKVKGLMSPEQGSKLVKKSYDEWSDINQDLWNLTNQKASNLDKTLTVMKEIKKPSLIVDQSGTPLLTKGLEPYNKFDNSPYQNLIKNYIKSINQKTPAQRESYKDALAFARYAGKLAPKNFKDAVDLRQNFNEHLDRFLKSRDLYKADVNTKNLVNYLKDNLVKDTVPFNASKVNHGDFREFEVLWKHANQSHSQLMDMQKGVAKAGNLKPKQVLREGLQQPGTPDAGILSEFIPSTKQTGIRGYKQLEKLVGDKRAAQDMLKAYYLRPLGQGASAQDISTIYSKLSPKQREYIFGGSGEAGLLKAVNEARIAFGKEPAYKEGWDNIGHHALRYSIPGMIGTGSLYAMGVPLHEAIMFGGLPAVGASIAAKNAIGKLASPETVLKAIKRAQESGKRPGVLTNFGLQQLGKSSED